MNRLKFVLFALVALGLWGYFVVVASPLGAGWAPGPQTMRAVASTLALELERARGHAETAVLKVARSPTAWNPGSKPGPPEDRFAAVRLVVMDALPDAVKARAVIAVTTEQGAVVAQGAQEPAAPPPGLDLAAIAASGEAGAVVELDGVPLVFASTPLLAAEKNEVRRAGTIVVGVPWLPDARAVGLLAKDLGLNAVALVTEDNRVVVSGGVEKSSVPGAIKRLPPGQAQGLVTGPVRELGPLRLPLFVNEQVHSVAWRSPIAGSALHAVAIEDRRPDLERLADEQVFGLASLAGLFLLAVAIALVIKGEEEGGGMVVPAPLPMPVPPSRREEPTLQSMGLTTGDLPETSPDDFHFPQVAGGAAPPPPGTGNGPAHQQGTFASSPSEFNISTASVAVPGQAPGGTGQVFAYPPPMELRPRTGTFEPPGPAGSLEARPPTGSVDQRPPSSLYTLEDTGPEQDPFAAATPMFTPAVAVPPPPPARSRPVSSPAVSATPAPAARPSISRAPAQSTFDDEEHQRTVAYPLTRNQAPSADPFASMGGSPAVEHNPDATRVASVPPELMDAARARGASGHTGERPALRSSGGVPRMPQVASPPSGSLDAEERHYQDVFKEFVATRERCGEPADGLPYDKFRAKLLKNREQLMAKHACRTVRFQVYVKEGKAALKATPVKD